MTLLPSVPPTEMEADLVVSASVKFPETMTTDPASLRWIKETLRAEVKAKLPEGYGDDGFFITQRDMATWTMKITYEVYL